MKLKNYIYLLAAVSLFFACSSENDPSIDPAKEKITLSVASKARQATTKADLADDDIINTLGVAIVYSDGTIQKVFPGTFVENEETETAEIEDITVEEGNATIFVFANIDAAKIPASGGKTALLAATTDFATEGTNGLTMSSQAYDVIFQKGRHHFLGYNANSPKDKDNDLEQVYFSNTSNKPVDLYRHAARVELRQLTLKETSNYGTPESFKLESVFMANVKGESKIASETAWGSIEVAAPAAWYFGSDVVIDTADSDLPYYTVKDYAVNEALLHAYTDKSIDKGDWMDDLDDPFYVYENMTETDKGNYTYLVISGYYTFEDENEENGKLRYWTVPVNYGDGRTEDGKETVSHDGIKRNYRYILDVTITGPGSDNPYKPQALINLNAEVVVNDWAEIVNNGGQID